MILSSGHRLIPRSVRLTSACFCSFVVSSLGFLPLQAAFAQQAPGACAVGVVNGDLTCTNSQTLTSSTPAQATMGATGNADITNTSTGVISAGSNASAVYAGGGLTLNNSGRIVTLAGGSNVTITANGSQTGTTTITNSGFIGDDAATVSYTHLTLPTN